VENPLICWSGAWKKEGGVGKMARTIELPRHRGQGKRKKRNRQGLITLDPWFGKKERGKKERVDTGILRYRGERKRKKKKENRAPGLLIPEEEKEGKEKKRFLHELQASTFKRKEGRKKKKRGQ